MERYQKSYLPLYTFGLDVYVRRDYDHRSVMLDYIIETGELRVIVVHVETWRWTEVVVDEDVYIYLLSVWVV